MSPVYRTAPEWIETHDDRLDAEDSARLLIGFRGQPVLRTPTMRNVPAPRAGGATAYVFDEGSGMVYIVA